MLNKRLNRRSFIKTSGAGVAGLTLFPQFAAQLNGQRQSTSKRIIFPINQKWLYSDRVAANGTGAAFDDRGMQRVTIPHTNKMLSWHGFDDKAYQFVSLYRRHFQLPPGLTGRRVFIDFGGVMTAATVFLNGQ